LANPYPTGTCTQKEAPSFAWRTNGCLTRPRRRCGKANCRFTRSGL